jgi:hypothetical protein
MFNAPLKNKIRQRIHLEVADCMRHPGWEDIKPEDGVDFIISAQLGSRRKQR